MNSESSKSNNADSAYQLKYNYTNSNKNTFNKSNYKESLGENLLNDDKNKEFDQEFIIERSYLGQMVNQTVVLTWKNYIFLRRNLKYVFFHLLTPILSVLILFVLQYIVDHLSNQFEIRNPEEKFLKPIPNCNMYESPKDCISIGYFILNKNKISPKDQDMYNDIMSYVSQKNNFELGKDVKQIQTTTNSFNDVNNYFNLNKNKTQFAILFCHDSMTYNNTLIPCKSLFYGDSLFYTLIYNETLVINDFALPAKLPYRKDMNLIKLKIDVDNAILKAKVGKNNNIDLSVMDFPTVKSKLLDGADIITDNGCFYFFLSGAVCFVMSLLEIVKEKELKLRKSLIIIGLKTTPYWMSWIITNFFFAATMPFILIIAGSLFKFNFFIKTNLFVLWIVFFLFNTSMQYLSILISTLVSTRSLAYTISYGFVIIGIVIQAILSNSNIFSLLYLEDASKILSAVRNILLVYPPFTLSKLVFQINVKSSNTFDMKQTRWVSNPGFEFKDLFDSIKGKAFDMDYSIPSPLFSILVLCGNICIFYLLALYFDHVIDDNQGKKHSYIFFLKTSFWCKKKNKYVDEMNKSIRNKNSFNETQSNRKSIERPNSVDKNAINNSGNSKDTNSISLEKQRVLTGDIYLKSGLTMLGLSKTYYISGDCCSSKEKKALLPTYLEVPEDELLTIIGHNGAGKTTLINILTGNIQPSSGTAVLSGIDIMSESVESFIGLCPQHDILWDELTAEDHVLIYCKLRSINKNLYSEAVNYYLNEVNLINQRYNPVETFSGGMKRRLSIILSTIGNPKLIMLDEPTTGLDPVNKRFIWKMIKNIKKNRSVILTTHAMEEADYLSDRIGIIKEGEFLCIGTSHQLKDLYGSGYLLTFIVDHHNVEEALIELKKHIPSGSVIATQGGSIIMNLPVDKTSEIKVFSQLLNTNKAYEVPKEIIRLKELVKDCGMDSTTLEEIFIKLTGKAKEGESNEVMTE